MLQCPTPCRFHSYQRLSSGHQSVHKKVPTSILPLRTERTYPHYGISDFTASNGNVMKPTMGQSIFRSVCFLTWNYFQPIYETWKKIQMESQHQCQLRPT